MNLESLHSGRHCRERRAEEIKKDRSDCCGFFLWLLHCSGNFTGSDASSAYVLSGNSAVFFNLNGLDIGIPLSSGMAIGVGNVVSGNLTLTANITLLRHSLHLLHNPRGLKFQTLTPLLEAVLFSHSGDYNTSTCYFASFFFNISLFMIKYLEIY